jgi:hypothetical protein
MPTPNDTTSLAYAFETTQGSGPANAAAWVTAVGALATGARIRHIMGSLDASSFDRETIEDERSQENVQDEELTIVDTIQGGIEFPHEAYFESTGVTTADATQAVATAFSNLLGNCLGGQTRTYSTTATGGTTTTAILTADTGVVLGAYVGVQLAGSSLLEPRRIVAWNDGTNTVTFDQALPSAVQAGDIIHGAITLSFDEDLLNDSSSPVSTLSWLLSIGRGTGREHWEARGCKSWIDSIMLPRNGAPKLAFKTKVASYSKPNDLNDPSFTLTPEGGAPVGIGPQTQLWMQDYGTTTNTQLQASDVSIKPGGEPAPYPTDTEAVSGMPGISHYGLTRDKTTMSFRALFDQDQFNDFDDQVVKVIRWSRRAGPGRTIAVALHRAQIVKTPKPQKQGPSLAMDLEVKALRDTTSVASTDLWRSRLVIVLC